MATERLTLTTDPVQITTGTETAYVVADAGGFMFADSDEKPDVTTSGVQRDEAVFGEPFKIWIWAGSRYGTTVTIMRR